MNVVLAADVEMVSDMFFAWREQGSIPGQDINFDFDNVTFVLNALDALAGDDRFLELRKRRPKHRTLERFDAHTLEARNESAKARKEKSKEHDDNIKKAIEEVQAKLKEIGRKPGRRSSTRAPSCRRSPMRRATSIASWKSRRRRTTRSTTKRSARSTTPRRPRSWACRAPTSSGR